MADRKLYDCIPMPIGLVEFRERDDKGDRMVCIEAQYLVDLYGEVADGKVVGVVRCGECKHYKWGDGLCDAWDDLFYTEVEADGFCHKGEPRDDTKTKTESLP